ncbi:MAG: OmpA family protein, partial [Proteobacteria bacterium]|nr:OmpA family protein [Pseudomonadota bacterium]
LAYAFKIEKKFNSKGDFLVHFIHFLHKAHAENKKVLLIIDEAQRIPTEMMEEIRLLSNIEKQDTRLLNIFLVGQDELNETLAEPRNRALLQRITTRYHIGPLKKNEIGDYINFRLQVAGSGINLFSSSAMREIISFSKCYPRLINVICDRALLTGYVKGINVIDAKTIKECAKELQAPKTTWRRKREKLKNFGKITSEAIHIKGQKLPWKIPAFSIFFALLLVAAGYFFLPGRYNRPIPNTKSVQPDNLLPMTQTKSDTQPEKSAGPIKNETSENLQEPKTVDKKEAPAEFKPQATTKIKKIVDFPGNKLIINFPKNSNEFSDEAYELLDRFVAVIFQNPDAEIIVKGYTDSSGNYNYNKRLSKFRANIVKSYLLGQGVSPSKIKTFGLGPENPIESNATEEGRNANRRIEIELKLN